MQIRSRTQSAVLTALILFSGCARPIPPPGGPPDRTAPVVEWTYPGPDSVGVDPQLNIKVRFSESMDRGSVERAVFVSPGFSSEPKLKWQGRELEIETPEVLRKDRTYLVTIGSGSSDESRNRMGSSYSFAFSTGSRLSKGEIRGSIHLTGGVQAFLWVYDLSEVTSPDPSFDPPDYVTQPGRVGQFQIPRIGTGRYRVFGFLDNNRDQLFTPATDDLAVPSEDLTVSSEEEAVELGLLKPALRDTTGPVFLSARTPDSGQILLRFNEPVKMTRPVGVSSASGILNVLGTYTDAANSSQVWILTAPQVAGEAYQIDLSGVVDLAGNSLVPGESAKVRGEGEPDRRVPEVVSTVPELGEKYVSPKATLIMNFSEAMDVQTRDDLWLRSDTTRVLDGKLHWSSPNQLVFEPRHAWEAGETFHVQVIPGILTDISGNALPDSPHFRFTISSPKYLGEVRGTVGHSQVQTVVQARQIASPFRLYQTIVAPVDTLFALNGLVPGKYQISGFLDKDGNGIWEMGSGFPFVPSEPLADYPDTLEVRARWATVAEEPVLIGSQFGR